MKEVYNVGESRQEVDIDSFSDDEVLRLADNLRAGLPIATPVFDGAAEKEIKELIERSEYKKARDKIKQFKQYSIDITDTKKEKKYEATFDIVFSITAKYLEKDPTRAAIIEPIVDECNELAEYNDYTEALSVIKRLEEAMGTSPVVGEFIELKNEVDRLSGMHSELKDEMSKRYQEIGDLIDKSEDKKARAKIQQFKQYLILRRRRNITLFIKQSLQRQRHFSKKTLEILKLTRYSLMQN